MKGSDGERVGAEEAEDVDRDVDMDSGEIYSSGGWCSSLWIVAMESS